MFRKLDKDKKGMMVGQIFVYAVTLFIVAFILIFGFKIINEFIGSSSDVEMLQFRKNMQSLVENYETEFGSVGYKVLKSPGNVKKICFTDYYNINTNLNGCYDSMVINPIIEDSYETNSREKKNFFLVDKNNEVIDSYFLGNVSVKGPESPCNYLCLNSSRGAYEFKIIGKGIGVQIEDVS